MRRREKIRMKEVEASFESSVLFEWKKNLKNHLTIIVNINIVVAELKQIQTLDGQKDMVHYGLSTLKKTTVDASTVKPVYNGHPWDLKMWSLCRGLSEKDQC